MKTTRRDNPKSRLGVTPFGDIGVYARETILRGERIASFDGPVFTWTSVSESIPNAAPVFARDHAIQFEEFRARDSNGLARFANHSCSPNAGIRNLFDIVAMRDIAVGEEVTWDYDMTEDTYWRMDCRCESSNCRKLIGGYRFLPPEQRDRYEGYISEWLLDPPRPYFGSAVENFQRHRFPQVPEGIPFRCDLERIEIDDEIMVITPDALKELIQSGAVTTSEELRLESRQRAV